MVTVTAAHLGDPMHSRVGLRGADFTAALTNAVDAGAVVSFAGAPMLTPRESGQFNLGHPPVLVVATMTLGLVPGVAGDRAQLASLLEANTIQMAIVDGPEPTRPAGGKSDPIHELFAEHYRILKSPAGSLSPSAQ